MEVIPYDEVEPNGHSCSDCVARQFAVCASLDTTEINGFQHLSRHVHFAACETVFAQEDVTTSFYNVLEACFGSTSCFPTVADKSSVLHCPATSSA